MRGTTDNYIARPIKVAFLVNPRCNECVDHRHWRTVALPQASSPSPLPSSSSLYTSPGSPLPSLPLCQARMPSPPLAPGSGSGSSSYIPGDIYTHEWAVRHVGTLKSNFDYLACLAYARVEYEKLPDGHHIDESSKR